MYFDKTINMDSDINLGRFYFIFLYVVKRTLVLFNIRLINIGQSSNFPDQFIDISMENIKFITKFKRVIH